MRINYLTLFLFLFTVGKVFAINTSFSAETRLKIKNFHNDSTSTSASASYLRSRLNVNLVSQNYKIYFQLQDNRLLGNQNNSPSITGGQNSSPSFHQVFGEFNGILGSKNKTRFGRFEMPLGNQRIFSNNNWNESGRSFEGITNIRKTRSGDILFFHLINAELFPMNDQFDYVVDGLYGTTKLNFFKSKKQTIDSDEAPIRNSPLNLDYYYYNEDIVITPNTNTKQRRTYGLRVFKKFRSIDFEAEFAFQNGEYYSDKINASLSSINIKAPINFTPLIESLSFSKEYISGDEFLLGGSDGELTGFAKPFGAAHKFHGYYDNPIHNKFLDNSHAGLNEWFIASNHKLFSSFSLSIKYHHFKDAINFGAYGKELDFILSKKLPFGGKLIQGFSIYYPEDRERLEAGYLMIEIKI